MVTHSVVAALELPSTQQRRRSQILSDYWALTKPEINLLIAITTAAGFWLASSATLSSFSFISLGNAVFGTVLVASGAAALNQVIELRFDAQMKRTMRRPAASGRNIMWACFFVWDGTLHFGHCVSGAFNKRFGFTAGNLHPFELSVSVYAAQAKDSTLHHDRRSARRDASADWLGCSFWISRCASVGTFRNCFPLAVSALHGHRVDGPRRLCACWVSCIAAWLHENLLRGVAHFASCSGAAADEPNPHDLTAPPGASIRWQPSSSAWFSWPTASRSSFADRMRRHDNCSLHPSPTCRRSLPCSCWIRNEDSALLIVSPPSVTALAAICGSLIGGLTSGLSTWITQRHQDRRDLLCKRIFQREALYSDFIIETSDCSLTRSNMKSVIREI